MVAAGKEAAALGTQYSCGAVRRCRLFRFWLLRLVDPHPDDRQIGGGRVALQRISYHGDVFDNPCGAVDRLQSSFGRRGVSGELRQRLSRLSRQDRARGRDDRGNSPHHRLSELHGRQVACNAVDGEWSDRAVRWLAARPWLRSFLRLSRCRDRSIFTRTCRRQYAYRSTGHL